MVPSYVVTIALMLKLRLSLGKPSGATAFPFACRWLRGAYLPSGKHVAHPQLQGGLGVSDDEHGLATVARQDVGGRGDEGRRRHPLGEDEARDRVQTQLVGQS